MQINTTPTLLQAIRQDPDTGLRWAMRDYAALVRGIARRILPGHDRDIEECTADVFVALWRNAARLEATGTPVRAWLIVTARNTAINRYRALQRHDTLPLTDELAATIADLPADPAGDAADELAVLVAALEPPDREIFLRKYYLMQSSREIAAALDLRVSTVNTRLSRGRDRLADAVLAKVHAESGEAPRKKSLHRAKSAKRRRVPVWGRALAGVAACMEVKSDLKTLKH